MSIATLDQVGDLPPVHWLTHLELWGHAPFTWIGDLVHIVFTQETLQWTEARWALLPIYALLMVFMTFEFVYWAWSWLRGRQINYDPVRATTWATGPNKGELKRKPIDLKKARARSFAWLQVGLPLYLVAAGMLTWYLLWPGDASRTLLAVLWFAFTPLRRILAIRAARKAYLVNHPGARFRTSLFQDAYAYFATGICRPFSERQKTPIEPPFENTTAVYRFLNWGHATFSRYGTFWRILRVWNFLRFWGILVQLVIAFFWPIAAVAAPFYYMDVVEDYDEAVNPWWRAYRDNEYSGGVVPPPATPAVA